MNMQETGPDLGSGEEAANNVAASKKPREPEQPGWRSRARHDREDLRGPGKGHGDEVYRGEFPRKCCVSRVLCWGGPARAGLAGRLRLLVGSGRSPGAVVGVLVGCSSSCAYA